MGRTEKILLPLVTLAFFAFLFQHARSGSRSVPPSALKPAVRAGAGGIGGLIDKVERELQVAKELKKAGEERKADPYFGLARRPSEKTAVGEKVEVPPRIREAWESDKDAGVLFGAHAIAGRGVSFEELERQKRVRCSEMPGVNYWSCRPEGDGRKFFCVDCYQVQVRGSLKDLGTRRWEPRPSEPAHIAVQPSRSG